MEKQIEFYSGMSITKKNILYITAGLATVLSIVLEILQSGSFDGYHMVLGLSGIVTLLMFCAAWKNGQNPEKPLYPAILYSLGGFFSPMIVQLLLLDIDEIEAGAVAELLLFLSPVISACVIGYHTRKENLTITIKTLLNAIPGFLVTLVCVYLMVRNCSEPVVILKNVAPVVFFSLVTLLSAYSEAMTDQTERRKTQWNSWRFFILLEVLIGVKNSSSFFFGYYCYIVFLTLLQITFPLILWQWKEWLSKKEYSHNSRTALYFIGAFLLTVLQSGGLRYLMDSYYISLSEEWMLIGTVVSLTVYWQTASKATVAGFAWSVFFMFVNTGCLFASNERLREVFYDLGGPAVNIRLSKRTDWLGYRISTLRATLSGDYDSLYTLYGHALHTPGFVNIVNRTAPFCVFPVTIAIFILIFAEAVLMVRFMENRKIAKIVGISMVLRSMIALVENVGLFSYPIDFAFTGYYISEYVLLNWMLRSETINVQNRVTENKTLSAAISPENKRIRVNAAILLFIAVLAECGYLET